MNGPPRYPIARRRRSARTESQIQRALRPSRARLAASWLAPRWLSIVLGFASFVGALALLTSPRFRVEQVVVRRESASALAAVTRASQLSNVVGHNIFLVNTTRVAQEVAAVPSVLRARIVPRLPNVVEIEIVERVPIATWRTATGAYLVDDQGYVVAETREAETQREPEDQVRLIVKDTTGEEVYLGAHVNQHALLAARELAKALPAAGAGVREVEYSSLGLVFVTDRQWRVIFGDTDSLNAKLANFKSIVDLARSQNLNIRTVDLRPKDRPFYQLATG